MRFVWNVAQSLDVSEFKVVKWCIIVLPKAPILGDASNLKNTSAV
jgi:uncharacterized ubiquitin-like protein YukD